MTQEPEQDPHTSRRGVLLGVGLVGLGGALAGCSTAAVPYDSNEAGQVGGAAATPASGGMASSGAPSSAMASSAATSGSAGTTAQGSGSSAAGSSMSGGTVLGTTAEIPVGGGMIFTASKVVVTQPVKGEFKAFSAICTHVGCIMDKVANGLIDCPCHGGQFKITTGAVVAGPPPSPLPAKSISVEGGKIVLA
jgi:Rieske Fe-S protein